MPSSVCDCLNAESAISAPSQPSPKTDGADEAQGKVDCLRSQQRRQHPSCESHARFLMVYSVGMLVPEGVAGV